MHALFRLPFAGAALLLAGAPVALAQSYLPDPVAPAVIGRPLDQLAPKRPVGPKPVPHKPVAAKPAPAKPVAAKAAAPLQLAAKPAAATAVAASIPQAAAVAPVPEASGARVAKQAVDDRADPRAQQLSEVGKGTHFARKPLGEGAYFGERHRAAARRYYEAHPVLRPSVKWKIGEPVPQGAVVAMVPRPLLAALPQVPPGHQYVELGGEVVLVAAASKMVVDGISRARSETALLSR